MLYFVLEVDNGRLSPLIHVLLYAILLFLLSKNSWATPNKCYVFRRFVTKYRSFRSIRIKIRIAAMFLLLVVGRVKFLGTKVLCTLGLTYTEGN